MFGKGNHLIVNFLSGAIQIQTNHKNSNLKGGTVSHSNSLLKASSKAYTLRLLYLIARVENLN